MNASLRRSELITGYLMITVVDSKLDNLNESRQTSF